MERRKTIETGRERERRKEGREKVRFLEAFNLPEPQNRYGCYFVWLFTLNLSGTIVSAGEKLRQQSPKDHKNAQAL